MSNNKPGDLLHAWNTTLQQAVIWFCLCSIVLYSCRSDQHVHTEWAEIEQIWDQLVQLEADHKTIPIETCHRLSELAGVCRECYADYQVAANALASTNFSGEFSRWERYISQAEYDVIQLDDYLSEAHVLNTRVRTRYERCRKLDIMGEIGTAMQCYQEVWGMLPEEHENARLLQEFRQAVAYSMTYLQLARGAYKSSLDWLDIVEKHLDPDSPIYPGLHDHQRARIAETLEHFAQAEGYYREANEHYLSSEAGRSVNHFAENSVALSEFYLSTGRLAAAKAILEETVRVGTFGDWGWVFVDYQQARVHLNRKDFGRALQFSREALDRLDRVINGKNYWKGRVLGALGESLAGQEKWESALAVLQEALAQLSEGRLDPDWRQNPDVRTSTTKLDLLKLLVLKSGVLRRYATTTAPALEPLIAALSTYRKAVELIRILRAEYNDDEVKQYLAQTTFPIFESALGTAIELYDQTGQDGYLHQAFTFFETSKALSLLENLKEMEARRQVALPDELAERENEYKYRIANLETSLRSISDAATRLELKELLIRERTRYRDLLEQVRVNHKDYYRLKHDTTTVGIAFIQEHLQSDESLVEYFFGREHLYAALITPDRQEIISIPLDGAMEQQLSAFIESVKDDRHLQYKAEISAFAERAYFLYRKLLEPLAITSKKLIIIPDGLLNDLPFAALCTTLVDQPKIDSLPYLLYRHTLHRNFSASVWRQQELMVRNKDNRPGSILVIAPEKFPETGPLSTGSIDLRDVFGLQARIMTNPNKATVKKALGEGYENVFIFTHASADGGLPFLLLANDTLFLHDLYNTEISANLVVLSACETGLGIHQRGEGVLSLGRGFAYRNVPNSVMTLWKVQDAAALDISLDVLDSHLSEGLSPSEALQQAQIRYLEKFRDELFGNTPFFWAGFVSTGK